ncbi:MAG: shikimate kinase [bacterium]
MQDFKNKNPKGKIFFGRIAVGKSAVGKKISELDNVKFIDCDKEIWKHCDMRSNSIERIKKEIRSSILSRDKLKYNKLILNFSKTVNWNKLFEKKANYEVSVLGNYLNINAIPKKIVDQFNVYKVMCFIETRQMNIQDRGLDIDWVQKVDFMFEDPSNLYFKTIFNEDILEKRKIKKQSNIVIKAD